MIVLEVGDIDLAATLRPLGLLRGDPTVRLRPGEFTRATTTPQGPGSVTIRWTPMGAADGALGMASTGGAAPDEQTGGRRAVVAASGPGGTWLLERAPGLVGLRDDPTGFAPRQEPLVTWARRQRRLRLVRTGTLWHDLACLIVQQRINGADAGQQWSALVRGLGTPLPEPIHDTTGPEPAPAPSLASPDVGRGPSGDAPVAEVPLRDKARRDLVHHAPPEAVLGHGDPAHAPQGGAAMHARSLVAPPDPEQIARLGYADLHPFGIERQRAQTLIRAARAVQRLGSRSGDSPEALLRALGEVPGIGPWTTTSLAAITYGHPDAAILGDYWIPSVVAWALAGERRADDARMLDLLEPYRPHRLRVVRILAQEGAGPPRRGHRMPRRDIRTH